GGPGCQAVEGRSRLRLEPAFRNRIPLRRGPSGGGRTCCPDGAAAGAAGGATARDTPATGRYVERRIAPRRISEQAAGRRHFAEPGRRSQDDRARKPRAFRGKLSLAV